MNREKRDTIKFKIKPSILVIHKISRYGGMTYDRKDIKREVEGVREDTAWETEKTIFNIDAYEEARRLRFQCQQMLAGHVPNELKESMDLDSERKLTWRALCASTPFGLVCPLEKERQLDVVIKLIHQLRKQYNKKWKRTKDAPVLSSFVMKMDLTGNAEEATKAVVRQLADILDRLKEALKKAQPKEIRQILKEAKGVDELLPAIQGEKVSKALSSARDQAREIAKLSKDKEISFKKIQKKIDTNPVELARFAFTPDDNGDDDGDIPSVETLRFAFFGEEEK